MHRVRKLVAQKRKNSKNIRIYLVRSQSGEKFRVLGQGIKLEPVAIDIDGKKLGAVSREGHLL